MDRDWETQEFNPMGGTQGETFLDTMLFRSDPASLSQIKGAYDPAALQSAGEAYNLARTSGQDIVSQSRSAIAPCS